MRVILGEDFSFLGDGVGKSGSLSLRLTRKKGGRYPSTLYVRVLTGGDPAVEKF